MVRLCLDVLLTVRILAQLQDAFHSGSHLHFWIPTLCVSRSQYASHTQGKRRLRDRANNASESEEREAADANVLPSIVKTSHFQRKIAKRLEFNDSMWPQTRNTTEI